MLISMASLHAGENCVNCGPKEPVGLPSNDKMLSALEKIAKKASDNEPGQAEYMDKYCLKFKQSSQEYVGSLIEEMETTPFPIDDYFKLAQCQPQGYSNVIKSPVLHIIADDPTAKEAFLRKIGLYYSKKRKKPEIFTAALNSKNTKGETLLDYIETLKENNINIQSDQQEVLKKIINYICSNGGVYSAYKNMKCPTTI